MDFSKVDKAVLRIIDDVSGLLGEKRVKAYLVGGFLRDVLLGRQTNDVDIAVAGDAPAVAQDMAQALGGKYVLLDDVNLIARVVLPRAAGEQLYLDFSALRGGIEPDLAQRDFTIDALAIDLAQWKDAPQLIDPFRGRQDIEQRRLKAASPGIFKADAARLLRAARLSAELGFKIESATESLIKEDAALVSRVAGERTREELLKLLATCASLFYLDDLGLLTAIIPELAAARNVTQPAEHYWDVFEHTLNVVAAVDFVLRKGACAFAGAEVLEAVPWPAEIEAHFSREVSKGSDHRILLKMAALLHDIAKPQTRSVEAGGRLRFFGHPQAGAASAVAIMERLRFSSREINLVASMVADHMRPTQMSNEGLPSNRAIYRYFRDTGEAAIDILYLSLADHLATRGPKLIFPYWQAHTKVIEYVLAQCHKEKLVMPPKLLDGHDLINIFGLNPGPRIGELLESVREAQASGEVKTREEALGYIRKLTEKQ